MSGGYRLAIDHGELDADLFAAHASGGQLALQAGEPERALRELDSALGLWRGPPLAEVGFEEFAQGEIRRLEELRLVAIETQIDARLQLGRHADVVVDACRLAAEHPFRERLQGRTRCWRCIAAGARSTRLS